MYKTLVVITLFTTLTALTSAFIIPQVQQIHLIPSALSPVPKHPAISVLSDKCTFTLYHKQLCLPTSPTKKTNYIQLNEIIDHPNDITIDIAGLREASMRNRYVKLGRYEAYAVEGSLGGSSLTIRGSDQSDQVRFEYDSARWTSDNRGESEDVYCDAGNWNVNEWSCGMGSRERRLHCVFTCEKIDPEDLDEAKAEDVKWISELR